jgi:hypothetical protein
MKIRLWFVLSVTACAVSWVYMHRVLLPWEYYSNVQPHGRLKAMLGDLYPRWVGTRELLLHGKNPYSTEVSHEIQMAYYGHSIEQTYDKPPIQIFDEQRFVYPIYVAFLLAPAVHMEFDQLNAWAAAVLVTLTAIGLWLWTRVLRWRPPPLAMAALILFVLASPQLGQGLRLRQPGLFVAFLLALGCWCVSRDRYFAAGVVLSLATIKPQMVILSLVWFTLWCLGDFRKRWPLAIGFFGSLTLLISAGEVLVPGWPRYFLEAMNAYRKYFPITPLLRLILGNLLGIIASIAIVAGLLALGWRNRKVATNSPQFVRMLSLFLIVSCIVLPLLPPSNQVLLFLPVIMLIRDWRELPRFWRWLLAVVLAWPWIVELVLLAHPPRINSMDRWPLLPSVLTLVVPLLALTLTLAQRDRRPTAIARLS